MYFLTALSTTELGLNLGKFYTNCTTYEVHPPYFAIGFIDRYKNLKGVAILNDYTGSSIELHLYAPGCFNRKNIKYVFDYVFNKLNCNIFIAKPYRSNKRMCRLLAKLNKNAYLTTIKQYYGASKDKDAILYIFDRNFASKWINLDAERT